MSRAKVTRDGFNWFFDTADINRDGKLSVPELADMLRDHGYRGSDSDIKFMFRLTDLDENGFISYDEFMEAMGQFPERLHINTIIRQAFYRFDKNNDGRVSRDELNSVARALDHYLTVKQVDDLLAAADLDDSGDLDYVEFCKNIYNLWSRCDILDMFFRDADQDADDYLTLEELTDMMEKLGHRNTKQITAQFKEMDTSKDGMVSYEEFFNYMGVTPENMDKGTLMRRIFTKFDTDGSGRIEGDELKRAMEELGTRLTSEQVQLIMQKADADGSGGIDYPEFVQHIHGLFASQDAYALLFQEADVDKDGSLTLQELSDMLRNHGYRGSDADVRRMFHETDFSGDRSITFEEYMLAMGRQPADYHHAALMRRLFAQHDVNGDGRIDVDELQGLLGGLGVSRARAAAVMRKADVDGSGSLDYQEFIDAVLEAQ